MNRGIADLLSGVGKVATAAKIDNVKTGAGAAEIKRVLPKEGVQWMVDMGLRGGEWVTPSSAVTLVES